MYVLPNRECPVVVAPQCDMLGCSGDAVVDAPTRMGPWANLCLPCAAAVGIPQMGTRLVVDLTPRPEASCPVCQECQIDDCPQCGCPMCEMG